MQLEEHTHTHTHIHVISYLMDSIAQKGCCSLEKDGNASWALAVSVE